MEWFSFYFLEQIFKLFFYHYLRHNNKTDTELLYLSNYLIELAASDNL